MIGTVALAGSLTPLEANLVIVSLPSMARAFDVSASDVIWAMVTATLTTVGLVLPIAVLSERWGRRNLFRYGFRVFAVGALAAMFAPGLPWLLLAWAIQGVGIGPTAVAMAYRDVVIVGLAFAVASLVVMFVFRGASMAARNTNG